MMTITNTEETRLRILRAAENEFLGKGYDSTRLEDIVREARVSKTAIYKIFGGKRELFLALNDFMVGNKVEDIIAKINIDTTSVETVKKSLIEIGYHYLIAITRDEAIQLLRLNISIAHRFKEAPQQYYIQGPEKFIKILAEKFKDLHDRKLLTIPDPEISAKQYVILQRGAIHLQALLDTESVPDNDTIRNSVENGVELFIKGHRKD